MPLRPPSQRLQKGINICQLRVRNFGGAESDHPSAGLAHLLRECVKGHRRRPDFGPTRRRARHTLGIVAVAHVAADAGKQLLAVLDIPGGRFSAGCALRTPRRLRCERRDRDRQHNSAGQRAREPPIACAKCLPWASSSRLRDAHRPAPAPRSSPHRARAGSPGQDPSDR